MENKIDAKTRIYWFEKLTRYEALCFGKLASYMINFKSLSIDINFLKSDEINLNSLPTSIITQENSQIRFNSADYLILGYSEYLCTNYIIPNKGNRDLINELMHEENRKVLMLTNRNELEQEILISLSRRYKLNVIEFLKDLIDTRNDFWEFYHPFCNALKDIDFQVNDLISFLEETNEYRIGDLMSGYMGDTLTYFGKHNELLAEEIYSKFINSNNEEIIFLLPGLITALSEKKFSLIHQRMVELSNGESSTLKCLGIVTLGKLSYDDEKYALEKTEEIIKEVLKNQESKVQSACCRAVYFLIENDKSKGQLLEDIELKGNADVQIGISWILNSRSKTCKTESWYLKLLYRLIGVNSKYKGITNDIDQALKGLLSSDHKVIKKYLEGWITSRNPNDIGLDIPKTFGSLWNSLRDGHPEFLQKLISEWFNSDEYNFHQALSHITSTYINFSEDDEYQDGLELDEEFIRRLPFRDIKFILFKILGFVIDSNLLCSLTFSLLKNENTDQVKQLVVEAFNEVIIYDYPVRKDFLKSRLKSGNKIEQETAKVILEKMEVYEESLKNLKRLKELEPSINKRRKQQLLNRTQREKIKEESQKTSVLFDVVKKIEIKYGRGWVTYQDGKIGIPSYMDHLSHSYTLPRSIFISPTQSHFQRIRWKDIKREEV